MAPGSTFRPMLAQQYPGVLPSGSIFSQPKLDGVRCLATASGLWSRTGQRITSCEHIEQALAAFFVRYPAAVLDGELYSHAPEDDLSTIISFVNSRALTPSKHAACQARIKLHVFDAASRPDVFSARWTYITHALKPFLTPNAPLRLVDTLELTGGTSQSDHLFATYLADGYEGQILRLDRPYDHARSPALLKRKPHDDDEFPIEKIYSAGEPEARYPQRVILRLPDGRTFGANIAGPREVTRHLLQSPVHSATIHYSGRTRSGIPRSPVAIALHSGERQF